MPGCPWHSFFDCTVRASRAELGFARVSIHVAPGNRQRECQRWRKSYGEPFDFQHGRTGEISVVLDRKVTSAQTKVLFPTSFYVFNDPRVSTPNKLRVEKERRFTFVADYGL